MAVIFFANLKGGVAKTTNAVAVAECLACSGKPTLLIDLDHQCAASELLLGESRLLSLERRKRTFHDLLSEMVKPEFERAQFDGYVAESASNIDGGLENLSVIPSSVRIDDFQSNFARGHRGFKTSQDFRRLFDPHRRQLRKWLTTKFAFVVVDCPPSLALQVRLLFAVTDTYVIPCQPNRLSIRGAEWLQDRIQKLGFKRDCLGTLWSMCRGNDRKHKGMITMAATRENGWEAIPTPFETTIPLAASIAHASEAGDKTVASYRAKYGTEFAKIYHNLVEEMVARLAGAGHRPVSFDCVAQSAVLVG